MIAPGAIRKNPSIARLGSGGKKVSKAPTTRNTVPIVRTRMALAWLCAGISGFGQYVIGAFVPVERVRHFRRVHTVSFHPDLGTHNSST